MTIEPFYTGEASAARPLAEHKARAFDAWDRIKTLIDADDTVTGKPITRDQRHQLREAAVKGFWLYPLVEAIRGAPR